MSLSPNPG